MKMRIITCMGLLVLMIYWTAGCSSIPITSTAERDAAFAPFRGGTIDDVPIEDFLASRTAIVIVGSDIADPRQTSDATGEGIAFRPSSKFGTGCAVMVDQRGYLLTAAHVVDKTPIIAVLYDGSSLRHYPARLVWNGFDVPYSTDLALLHIDTRLPAVFQWAEQYETDENVLAAGLNYSENPRQKGFIMGFTAGKLLPPLPAGNKVTRKIASDLPLHPGDSGGPLVNAEGRLIAINVRGKLSSFEYPGTARIPISIALRPDSAWLQQRIEQDFSSTTGRSVSNHGRTFSRALSSANPR